MGYVGLYSMPEVVSLLGRGLLVTNVFIGHFFSKSQTCYAIFADMHSFMGAALPLHLPLAQPDPIVFLDEEDLDLTLSFLLFDALNLTLVSNHCVRKSFTVENFIIDFHH